MMVELPRPVPDLPHYGLDEEDRHIIVAAYIDEQLVDREAIDYGAAGYVRHAHIGIIPPDECTDCIDERIRIVDAALPPLTGDDR